MVLRRSCSAASLSMTLHFAAQPGLVGLAYELLVAALLELQPEMGRLLEHGRAFR